MFIKNKLIKLIELINRQDFISNITFDSENYIITYTITYGINKKEIKRIFISEEYMNDIEINNYIFIILKKYNLLKEQTSNNINKKLREEYIYKLIHEKELSNIPESIDKELLLQELINRKDEIIEHVDDNIYTNSTVSALESLILTFKILPFNKEAGITLLIYSIISPILYTTIPIKVDKKKNKKKYKEILEILENSKQEPKKESLIKDLIIDEIIELETYKDIDLSLEIKKLKDILKDIDNIIDIETTDKIIDILLIARIKIREHNTIYIEDYKEEKKLRIINK